ncbi:MAG: hypothetical protein JL56_16830 [Desulfotomaculum sp. BICA1-6]|nr:MAG: hypothetical protein VR67_05745 [Peptococcaceae bacterium BRH_c8a]KJS70511.1 MAG: hypothetical protein JL56_16830 [Desulfotomaculum sp. BICA1-6]
MVGELARQTGRTEEQVIESIIEGYLMRQLRIIEKRSAETGTPVNDLLNVQFERLLELMLSQAQGNPGGNNPGCSN